MKTTKYILASLFVLFYLAGCESSPFNPEPPEGKGGNASKPFGLVEVTITGIGTEAMTATAEPAVKPGEDLNGEETQNPRVAASLTSFGTIQMEPLRSGSFTTRHFGVRYVFATFKVRNAADDGTPYTDALDNLTFLAVDTDATHGVSAVSELRLYNDDLLTGPVAESIAMQTIPTGKVTFDKMEINDVSVTRPDVLQVFTETQANTFQSTLPAGLGINDIFQYGFITASPNTTPGSRQLPVTSATPVQFDGIVTFAFKVPLQTQANKEPFTIKMMFLPVEDSETRITQSREEQTEDGVAAFEERVESFTTVDKVHLLYSYPNMLYLNTPYLFSGEIPYQLFCDPVRVAGTTASPVGLFNTPANNLQSFTPNPYNAGANNVTNPAQFQISFDASTTSAAANKITVFGSQSGEHFGGTTEFTVGVGGLVTAPSETFIPGEIIEITIPVISSVCKPTVVRYRVETGTNTLTFTRETTPATGNTPLSAAAADFDKDGDLDLAVANQLDNTVSLLLNDGFGTFIASTSGSIYTGDSPNSILAGDFNNDGWPDLITTNGTGNTITRLENDQSGNFLRHDWGVGNNPNSVTMGDINGDGILDLAVTNSADNNISILINEGGGRFPWEKTYPFSDTPSSITSADFDNDGDIDLAVTSEDDDSFIVMINNGLGIFSTTFGPYAVGNSPQKIISGDYNEDGYIDIAIANIDSDGMSVLYNDGNGRFDVASGDFTYTIDAPNALIDGDFDGDGDLDIAAVSAINNNVTIFGNSGSNFSVESPITGVGTYPIAIITGVLDDDDALDLVTVNRNSNDLRILLN